jgi:hypothetical protein
MTLILLTGAGFSRNWGGWLASEAFEYLLGREEVGGDLRRRLWKDKIKGKGFEDTLADLQHSFKSYQREADRAELNGFRAALSAMFAEMNESFSRTQFEFTNDVNLSISKLLSTFDFIFTLNQDLLLEHHYVGQDNLFGTGITRCEVPGLTLANPAPHGYSHDAKVAKRKPIDGGFRVEPSIQPYFKLHGSSNWLKANGDSLLVLGGGKSIEIEQEPLLKWYQSEFKNALARPNAKLMVIGYSFGDDHINTAIQSAVTGGDLKLFIVDPAGVDVLDRSRGLGIPPPNPLRDDLATAIWGASRRGLSSILTSDRVEFAKLSRFFA